MNNTTIVAIHIPFVAITAGIFVVYLFRRFKRLEHYLFMLLCLCTVCWFASRIAGILSDSVDMAKFFINFSRVFVGFIPPLLLLTILAFYRMSCKMSKHITVSIFIIPTINIVMALTAKYHTLVNKKLEIVSLSPFREVVLEWGSWFWVHTVYCYTVSMFIIGIVLLQHFRSAGFYRTPSIMMVAGVLVTLAGNIVTLLQLLPLAIDPTLISLSLSLIFFDWATFNNNNSKFVRFSRGQLFQYLHEYILVLDEKQRIVYYNRSALDFFPLGKSL